MGDVEFSELFREDVLQKRLAELEKTIALYRVALQYLERLHEATKQHLALLRSLGGVNRHDSITPLPLYAMERFNQPGDAEGGRAIRTMRNSPVVQCVATVMKNHIEEPVVDRKVHEEALALGLQSHAKTEKGALGTIRWALEVLASIGLVKKVSKATWMGLAPLREFHDEGKQPDPNLPFGDHQEHFDGQVPGPAPKDSMPSEYTA